MRVLHINAGNEDGGARTYIINLMKGQKNIGVDSTLMTFQEGPVSQMARHNGLDVIVLPQKQRFDLSILSRMKDYINKNNFDVVTTHGPRANFLVSRISKKISAKWAITVHSDPRIDFSGLKGSIMIKLNMSALKKADFIFYINPDLVEYFEDNGINPYNLFEVFNAIEFKNLGIEPTKQEIFSILEVARLVEIKNHRLLLLALSKVNFDFKLTLVGDGPMLAELKEYSKELNIADKVDFAGFHENTGDYYQSNDITILTSKSESLPAVYFESAQYARPVIATNVGATSKLINNNNGWLVESENVDGLVAALNDAYASYQNGTLDNKGFKLFDDVKNNFSIDKLAQKFDQGYSKLLSR
ncbi:glycosyltransferase [Companilactobacillus metriopterae]|uniref:glycosyltransferase n=1 Tax=Companilactobacillus metriopterae TaxID=1909267 RepID=UPI00100A4F94|nr:glycosyltransferase [Companilactobacillus metriopterae]